MPETVISGIIPSRGEGEGRGGSAPNPLPKGFALWNPEKVFQILSSIHSARLARKFLIYST